MRRPPTTFAQLAWLVVLVLPAAIGARPALAAGSADESAWELGLLVGGGFYQINSPEDPPGALTFLYGSAFSGGGFTVGATGTFDPTPLFGLEADLLLGWTSLDGSAESEFARRDVSLDEVSLRLALLARLRYAFPNPEIEFGLGPELAVGLGSAIQETVTGIQQGEAPLETDTGVWLIGVAQAGAAVQIGRFSLPILVRLGWNPFYPDTTGGRFESFQSTEAPGPFKVGFDWYVVGLVGVRFHL